MIRTWINIGVFFIVIVLLQALAMNNIHLFHIVTPFIYIYLILKLPFNLSRSSVIFVSFLLGLAVDSFSDTFGLHAVACSFLGLIRPPLAERFVNLRDIPEGSVPSFRLFGFAEFVRYAFLLVAMHHILLFSVEAFTFFQPLFLLIRIALSILFSCLLILIIEAFNPEKKKGNE